VSKEKTKTFSEVTASNFVWATKDRSEQSEIHSIELHVIFCSDRVLSIIGEQERLSIAGVLLEYMKSFGQLVLIGVEPSLLRGKSEQCL